MKFNHISSPVQHHMTEFEQAFEQKLHSNSALGENVVRYIASLQGKRLRPLLVLLSAQLNGEINEKTINSAISIEMLHTATLIHDDVVDNSSLRRGSPTVNNMWDSNVSILIGDFLFSRTLSSMVNLKSQRALEIFSHTAEQITEGELFQLENGYESKADKSAYFNLIEKKTASLFAASCQLGALSVSDDEKFINDMDSFGLNLGIAFQLMDDLLDYTGDEKKLGKPIGNDLREGKITLPLIYAMENCVKTDCDKISSILDKDELSDDDIAILIQAAKDQGGIDHTIETANAFAQKAKDTLKSYSDSETKQSLINLVEFTVDREV